MANTVYKVKSGDNLTKIAASYNTTVAALLKLNPSITNPDYIVVGQEIIVSGTAATAPKKNTSNKANILLFGLQSDTDRTVYATWKWDKDHTENYRTVWYYSTGDGVWFLGSDSTTTFRQSTYTAPSNATSVKFRVKPISKKYTDKNKKKEVSYWTAEWSTDKKYSFSSNPPTVPSGLTAKIENNKLTAELDNLNVNGSHIEFQIVKNDKSVFKTGKAAIKTKAASYSCAVNPGTTYKVRCRAYREKDKEYSDWSEFVDPSGGTSPTTPGGIKTIKALSETSVQIDWENVSNADNYEIQYTIKKTYFDSSPDDVTTKTVDASVVGHAEITGLTSGEKYFFRVRATNANGASDWTEIVSIVLGKEPSAPTTWSSRSTVTSGEELYLYWVHNSQDGSSETYAELELLVNGVKQDIDPIKKSTAEDEKDRTSAYKVNTSVYSVGTKLQWRVRTKGILDKYSDWSIMRTVDIYATPTLSLDLLNTYEISSPSGGSVEAVTTFPFYISAKAGPDTQKPIGYHVSIVADSAYDGVDEFGNKHVVSKGQEIYSKYFETSNDLMLEMSANNIDLANNASYLVRCTVSMNSGLTAEDEASFYVFWDETNYTPNAEIGINEDNYTASIIPYCKDEDENLVDGVTLSVYRREFDGGFTELMTDIPNNGRTTVPDPHPSLDYARYRIVAKVVSTGAVQFYDVPGHPVQAKEVVIQWAEKWTSFDTGILDTIEEPSYSGTILKLPYNIDVSDSNKPDVALVEYIGREHPVSYYGTQLGESSTWNVAIDKSDVNTLYALRRLAKWMGDVYVREPSGSGYWANITVSFSQKHRELTIPVTLNITRVAGGM